MDFLRPSLLLRELLHRWRGGTPFEDERDRPEYAGPFVADTLERLERLTRDYIDVSGQPVAVQVTEVDVRSSAFIQVIDVSLLAQRLGDLSPSDDVKFKVPTELTWQVSSEPREIVRVNLPQSFFYTLTSELSVGENLKALTDYIQQRFDRGQSTS